jgi:hypothetical protein
MIKKPYFLLFALILTALSTSALAQNAASDTAGIKKAVNDLFDGMRKSDSVLIRSAFAPGARLETVITRNNGVRVASDALDSFVVNVVKPHAQVLDERIQFGSILIDGDMAHVWTPYKFYFGETLLHCGVNQFVLVRLGGVWRIQYLIDTRRKQPCN